MINYILSSRARARSRAKVTLEKLFGNGMQPTLSLLDLTVNSTSFDEGIKRKIVFFLPDFVCELSVEDELA